MSNGIVVSFNLVIPPNRLTQTVSVAKTGGAVKLQDQVIELSFMDRDLSLLAAASETFRDPGKDSAPGSANPDKMYQNKVKTKSSLAPTFVPNNDSSSPAEDLQQLGIFVSEHEIKVISLPGYHQIFSYKPDIPLVKVNLNSQKKMFLVKINSHSWLSSSDVSSRLRAFDYPQFANIKSPDDIPIV